MNIMLIDAYCEYDKNKTITILEEFTKKLFWLMELINYLSAVF